MRKFTKAGKVIGELGDDGVFRKKIKASKHILRKWDAIGIDKETFDSLPEDCEIRIWELEKNEIYSISHQHAAEVKFVGEFGDSGLQVFIPRSAFTK